MINRNLKNNLKKISVLYNLNACIKARAVKKQYHKTVAYYASKQQTRLGVGLR